MIGTYMCVNVFKLSLTLFHFRFNFGKFLKGIGLSVEDALTFWEQTYSKEHTSGSKCTHNWTENEKRYTYSIRHLYGLEGSKRDYCIKSCQQIQVV